MFVYGRWSIVKLIQEGNARQWCHTADEYVAFHTNIALCENKFNMFCGNDRMCRYARRMKDQEFGDAQSDCWKDFLYQQQLPQGLPVEGNTLLCQRFSRTGVYGHMFGENRAYFATSYSPTQRIPTFSFGMIKEMADMGWPHAPYMVERGENACNMLLI